MLLKRREFKRKSDDFDNGYWGLSKHAASLDTSVIVYTANTKRPEPVGFAFELLSRGGARPFTEH